jgi:glycosyltransferase involved in cell wall biosynthesis
MPLRLLLLGDGPERYRLAARANVLGIAEDVRFEGYVTNPLPYFRNSALFVLSSRWEGMSNALLEALAVGCISVATRCPGSVEVLGETLSSQIVPVSDTHALASAIVTNVVSPPPKGHFLARAAEYDLRSTLNAYVDVLREEAARL